MINRLKSLKAGNSWDFRYCNEPRCPHCGYACNVSDNDWWRIYDEGEHEVECPLCEQGFTVSTHVQHTFSTDEQKKDV